MPHLIPAPRQPSMLLKAALVAAFCVGGVPAAVARPGQDAKTAEKPAEKPRAAISLDDLYARLKAAEDDAEAKGIARLIEQRLGRSGSATADLLTERARQAMSGHDFPLAIELLDRATTLEPGWSEGWNRRAPVFWLLTDKDDAIADLRRALVLEPRHFEAWAAMGRIYESLDDKARALAAFRRAKALYPTMEKIGEAVDRLAPEVDGRDL